MSSVAARLLREARARAGLSQADLAARAGSSQPAVSAYEAGRKDPAVGTLARLLWAAGASLELADEPGDVRDFVRAVGLGTAQLETLDAAARRIVGGEEVWLVLREFLDGAALIATVRDDRAVADLVAGQARASGRPEVDALLGGIAEHLATAHGFPRPSWCTRPERFLDVWWFPHTRRAFDAIALRDAPAAFRRRGIFLHPSMLERI